MGLSIGIVGLPNVGKSTIFNALTAAGAPSANYPFCTIEPNVGVVSVPDARLGRINKLLTTEKVIPAVVEFVDIAGLVKGASKGEGRGNQFLANIRETDAILSVVRCFEDDGVVHVDGSVDPLRDIDVIELELVLADLETVEKRLKKAQSAAKSGGKEAKEEQALLERMAKHLNEGKPARTLALADEQLSWFRNNLPLLTVKPMLYCCNVAEGDIPAGNALSGRVAQRAAEEGAEVVIVCGTIEEELAGFEGEEQSELLDGYGLQQPALNNLISRSYRLLGLRSYFTAGPKEIRAWTIRVGDTAPQAAGVIHSDFERGFIRANVYSVDDLEACKSEAQIKAQGKMRTEGKDYVVRDGDVMHFLFNV